MNIHYFRVYARPSEGSARASGRLGARRACTQRSQLVAKVRASPNNGFPHGEQIGGTIYLSGAPANVRILTREQPRIFNLRACCRVRVHVRHAHRRTARDPPLAISMRNKKKERPPRRNGVAFNYPE